MERHGGVVVVVSLLLVGCGGGGDEAAGGGGGGGGGGTNTEIDALNVFRAECDGASALETVSNHTSLETSAIRHAGWQAIDDATQANANLNHGEPRTNALFTHDDLGERIRTANSGNDISGANAYYEDIASTAGTTAIVQLWNTVFHRIPMMRHRARHVGYGDMALARALYPPAGVPTDDEWGNTPEGNGYATLNWSGYDAPAITLSYWPGNNTTGVPPVFASDQEGPDPVSGRNQVGCPIHVIFPDTSPSSIFTSVNITLVTGSTHIPLLVMVGNASPSGAAGDVATLIRDPSFPTYNPPLMDPGELFAIPIPGSSGGLSSNTTYTYNVSVVLNGETYNTDDVTFTTGP